MFPAERMSNSKLFVNAEVTPFGGSLRTIRACFTNENSPSSMGSITVINDFPTADVLTSEITAGALDIGEKTLIKNLETLESFYVTAVGYDDDGFTQLELSRDIP